MGNRDREEVGGRRRGGDRSSRDWCMWVSKNKLKNSKTLMNAETRDEKKVRHVVCGVVQKQRHNPLHENRRGVACSVWSGGAGESPLG